MVESPKQGEKQDSLNSKAMEADERAAKATAPETRTSWLKVAEVYRQLARQN
jgi:hypothetical protein